MDFEQFQEESVAGELAACYVTYSVTYAVFEGEEIGKVTVTGERDELVDFESALSDEATDPIADELEEFLSEQHDIDIEVTEFEVKHILVRTDNEDLTSTYIAFTPDGRTLSYQISAEENFETFLQSLLK
jgi:hypothetical protein